MRWLDGLDGQEFEQAPGVGNGQGGLACCSPWGHKESDTTERLNSKLPTVSSLVKQGDSVFLVPASLITVY